MDYNERVMHKKISKLQLKLLDYTDKEEDQKKSLESNEPTIQVHKMRKEKKPTQYPKTFLLVTVCVICPVLFPIFVYNIEEYRPLFWPVTGFSTFAGAFLFLYLSSRIPVAVAAFRKIFHGAHSKVKIVVQDTEYFSNRRRIQCAFLVLGILSILGVGYWADGHNPVLFNSCLVAVGYIAGILSVNLYGFVIQSKRLPQYSPLHKKRDGPTRRELDFSSAGLTASPCLSPNDCFRPSPEREKKCSELIHRGPLPVPPLPPPLKPIKVKYPQRVCYSPFN